MMRPRITVEIPFYNNSATLADAIKSVFAQTFGDWELILADDGSVDKSLALAKSIDDPRVRVVENTDNRGVGFRLNQMAEMAVGEYVARMDADDVMHPERLARQVEFLESRPDVDVVGTSMYTIDGANRVTGLRGAGRPIGGPADVVRGGLCHPTVMARAEWFRKNRYDEHYRRAQDLELWCRTCLTSRFVRLDHPLLFYRENYRDPAGYLRTYLRSGKFERMIYRTYGPRVLGWPSTLQLIAGTYAKGAVYATATCLGLQGLVVRKLRRGALLSQLDLACAQTALDAALGGIVPSWRQQR